MPTETRNKATSSTAGAPREKKGIQSVEVGVRVVDALARANAPLPLRDIGKLSGISASQAHRYLTSFAKSGLVVQDPATGHYGLGPQALQWGVSAMNKTDSFVLSSQALDRICTRFDLTGLLCVWGECGPTCVRLKRSTFLIGTDLGLGSVFPLMSSASGHVFLAHLQRAITRPFVQKESPRAKARGEGRSTTDLEKLCQQVREDGYAAVHGHYVSNLSAIAAPVLDHQGGLAAVITLIFREPPGQVITPAPEEIARALLEETRSVSRSLGWGAPAAVLTTAAVPATPATRTPRKPRKAIAAA